MNHKMKLNDIPFNLIKENKKTVELRLNDEKRRLLNIKDLIEFTNLTTSEKLTVEIIELLKYDNFKELYKNINKVDMGYDEKDIPNQKDMELYYSLEEQNKYGVLGIKIKKL